MLLALQHVEHRREHGGRREILLRDVTLEIDIGDFVAVVGADRAQRTALLQVSAGLARVDGGSAHLAGEPLTAALLGKPSKIALAHRGWTAGARTVAGQVAVPAIMTASSVSEAEHEAHAMLDRVGAGSVALHDPEDLSRSEMARVMIARALMTAPRLLLVDTPTDGLGAGERDAILDLLRSLAVEERLGVLIAVEESVGLTGRAHRTLRMHRGELHGARAPQPAPVYNLHGRRADSA